MKANWLFVKTFHYLFQDTRVYDYALQFIFLYFNKTGKKKKDLKRFIKYFASTLSVALSIISMFILCGFCFFTKNVSAYCIKFT